MGGVFPIASLGHWNLEVYHSETSPFLGGCVVAPDEMSKTTENLPDVHPHPLTISQAPVKLDSVR